MNSRIKHASLNTTRIFSLIFIFISQFMFCNIGDCQSLYIRTVAGKDSTGFTPSAPLAMKVKINAPSGVTMDNKGNLYFTNDSLNLIMKESPNGNLSVYAGGYDTFSTVHYVGDSVPATNAVLWNPQGLACDKYGNLFICDYGNYVIRKVDTNGYITRFAGNAGGWGSGIGDGGPATHAEINCYGITFDKYNNLYFTDAYDRVEKIDTNGIIRTVAGGLVATSTGAIVNNIPADSTGFGFVSGIAVDTNGNIYIADASMNMVRVVRPNDTIYAFAGTGVAGSSGDNGPASTAKLSSPQGLAIDNMGNLLIADKGNNRIRKISLATDTIKTFAGTGTAGFSGDCGVPTSAAIKSPMAIWFQGGDYFIADQGNYSVREVLPPDTLLITSTYGNARDSICKGTWVSFTATVKHPTFGDTLRWVKNRLVTNRVSVTHDSVYTADSFYMRDSSFFVGSILHDTLVPADTLVIRDTSFVRDSTYATDTTIVVAGNVLTWADSGFATGDTIKCILFDPGGCTSIVNSNKITMYVKSIPVPITGPTTICAGPAPATIVDTSGTGRWTITNHAIATLDSFSHSIRGITASTPGVDTVYYTLTDGCRTSLVFTINPAPHRITGSRSVCTGATTTLSITDTGGIWGSTSPGIASVSSSGVVSTDSDGTSLIYYLFPDGCASYDTFVVNPYPTAVVGLTNICRYSTSSLSDSLAGGRWISSDTLVSRIDSMGNLTGIGLGRDTITYRMPSGCSVTVFCTVNAAPLPISGIASHFTTICNGTFQQETETYPGGIWSTSDSTIVSLNDSGLVYGVRNDTAVISYTISDGCAARLTIVVDSVPSPVTGSDFVCVGLSTTLANAATGMWWATDSNVYMTDSTSGVIYGNTAGLDTIVFSVSSGCVTSKVVSVLAAPLPILGPDSVCAAATVRLADSISGGMWSVSDTTVATINDSGVVTGVHTGPVTIFYLQPNGCLASRHFSTNLSPAPFDGSLTVCPGVTVAFTDTSFGGAWTLSNTNITMDEFDGLITGVNPGFDTVTYTLATSCSITGIITINPAAPAITGVSSICIGQVAPLTDSLGAGTWESNDTIAFTVGISSGIVTGVSAGSATVTYTSSLTGCPTLKSITVHPLPAAVSGLPILCQGTSATFHDSTAGGSWSVSSASIASVGTTGIVTGLLPGLDSLSYRLATTGCASSIQISVNPAPAPVFALDSVCALQSILISDTTPGGIWSVSDTAICSISDSGVLQGMHPGATFINYTGPNGCVTKKMITVNPIPLPIICPDTICTGISIILRDSTHGCNLFSADTFLASSIAPGVIIANNPGLDTVVAQTHAGCISAKPLFILSSPAPISGPAVVCIGTPVVFIDSVTGGTWLSSDSGVVRINSASGIANGLIHDTTSILYVGGNNCVVRLNISANTPPAGIAFSDSICAGTPSTLTDATGGGSWLSIDTNIALINATGLVTAKTAGIDSIVYILPGGCFSQAAITINPVPASIEGVAYVCNLASTTLTDSTPGGMWLSSNTAVATIGASSGYLFGYTAGVVTITYTTPNGCSTTIPFSVNPLPFYPKITTHPDTNICGGAMFLNFGTDTSGAGITFTWNCLNAMIWTQGSGHQYCLVDFNVPDTVAAVTLTSTFAGYACSTSDVFVAHVQSAMTDTINITYSDGNFICNPNTTTCSYQWGYDTNDSLQPFVLAGETAQTYLNTSPDFVHKFYWVERTCGGCTQKAYYNTPSMVKAVSASQSEAMFIYPNPATNNTFNIEVSDIANSSHQFIEVSDVLGQIVFSGLWENLNSKTQQISIPGATGGIYFVKLSGIEGSLTGKVVLH